MIKARRIGHATYETPDLDRQIEYYNEVVGLVTAARDRDRAFLATKTGQLVVDLVRGGEAKCVKLAFEVGPGEDFADMAKRLTAEGIKSDIKSDDIPGTSRLLSFTDNKGTTIELFKDWSFLGRDMPVYGVGPLKLGHLAFATPDPRAAADFYCRVLGFKVSDWIEEFFVFLRCGPDHHTVNFIVANTVKFHHVAYELKDMAHMQAACEWLGRKKIDILWGPGRHGAGHNVFIYHRNPDGQMIEFYTEMDKMMDEELGYFEPRPWHVDQPQRPKVWDRKSASLVWGPPPTPEFLRGRDAPPPI